jgi:hypothetical protein
MTRNPYIVPLFVTLGLAGVVRWFAPAVEAQPPQFDPAALFLELNDTDGDLGLHASIGAEPWIDLEIEGPGDRSLLEIVTRGRLRTQGLSEIAFESAEPSFDELDPADFFRRFPEGRYEISGHLLEGGEAESRPILSHVLAAAPGNVLVSGALAAESCDDPLPLVVAPVTIDWDPVTTSHPEIGKRGAIRVRRYQLFVEGEGIHLGLDLPSSVTSFTIPAEVTDRDDRFKFEIITQTTTGNNTAIESCFLVQN